MSIPSKAITDEAETPQLGSGISQVPPAGIGRD